MRLARRRDLSTCLPAIQQSAIQLRYTSGNFQLVEVACYQELSFVSLTFLERGCVVWLSYTHADGMNLCEIIARKSKEVADLLLKTHFSYVTQTSGLLIYAYRWNPRWPTPAYLTYVG